MLRLKQLPTFDAVAAGKKAVCKPPLGLRYHAIWLELGNNAIAANTIADLVDDVVVKINGKPQRTHTGVQLDELNGINGAAYGFQASGTSGQADRRIYLPIWFAQPWRKNPSDAQALALRANGIEDFAIEVNVKAALAAPIVAGWYEFDYDTRAVGLMSKVMRYDYGSSGTVLDIQGLEKRDFIESIHLFPDTSGTPRFVTEVKFTVNGEELRDRITHLQNRASIQGRELVADTATPFRYDLVFDFDDPINGALPTQRDGKPVNEMTLKVTWDGAAAGTMPVLVVRTGPPE